jgi:hypothetical protein
MLDQRRKPRALGNALSEDMPLKVAARCALQFAHITFAPTIIRTETQFNRAGPTLGTCQKCGTTACVQLSEHARQDCTTGLRNIPAFCSENTDKTKSPVPNLEPGFCFPRSLPPTDCAVAPRPAHRVVSKKIDIKNASLSLL